MQSIIPIDHVRLMVCMYIAYPIGWFMKSILKGTNNRHLFSIIVGLFIQFFMFRFEIIHPMIMTAVAYLLMHVLPREQQNKAVIVFVMVYLSTSHIYRMITNFGGWDMDITTYTMILTTKLSALAFCYRDGGQPEDKLLPE